MELPGVFYCSLPYIWRQGFFTDLARLVGQSARTILLCLSSQDWADRHVLPRLLFSPVGSSDLTQALVSCAKCVASEATTSPSLFVY